MSAITGPLAYLYRELGFKSTEWQELSKKDREDLKKWAEEEMKNLVDNGESTSA